jgi:acid phosphatase (class A)
MRNVRTYAALAALMMGATLVAAPGQAAVAPPAQLKFLAPEDIDPARLLPAPPAEGSAAAKAELAEVHAIEAVRTREQLEAAKADDLTEDASIFAVVFGPGFELAKLPATAAMLKDLRADEKIAAKTAKNYFLRTRPWIVDPSLHPCATDDAPKSSYPSGHTTHGFAMAVVLAKIAPDKAQALLARAKVYGENRMVCGMHFRADVTAGQTLGTLVGEELLEKPGFLAEATAAKLELQAAHLIAP